MGRSGVAGAADALQVGLLRCASADIFRSAGWAATSTAAGCAFAGVMLDVLTAELNDGLLRMAKKAADGIYDNYYTAYSPGSARSARSIRYIYINRIKRMSTMAAIPLAVGSGWKFDVEGLAPRQTVRRERREGRHARPEGDGVLCWVSAKARRERLTEGTHHCSPSQ
jgi:hypothetical protein